VPTLFNDGPTLEELSEKLNGKLKIGKINIETPARRNLVVRYQIQSIFNMKLFKQGKKGF
jgi:thioredoxin-like negative regulator of GroEL